ncbi:MAG TPA: hypothetical protein VF625_18585, partial [Longimicrobium sp.]
MNHLRRWAPALVGLILLGAAGFVLQRELRDVSYREVRATLAALPPISLWISLVVCAANYAVLTGFDMLAFHYVGRRVAPWKVAVASFTGYAISNSVGFAILSGTSVRYRFYSRWGLSATEISRIVLFYVGTFWLGLLALGGWTLAIDPHPALLALPGGSLLEATGWLLLAAAAGYMAMSFVRR